MLYPNYNLPKSLKTGDSLIFVIDTITDYNPEISLSIDRNGRVSSSLLSYSYPTAKGIITSKADRPISYSTYSDTISQGDSLTIVEYTFENEPRYNHGPAAVNVCLLDLTSKSFEFTCGVLIRFGANGTLKGPFEYQINDERLILIKK